MSAINANKRGSIMIATLLMAIVTGALVGLYLRTVAREVEESYYSRMSFQAVNLAESSLEYVMSSLINKNWNGWTKMSKGYYRENFDSYINYTYNGEENRARVYVEPNWATNPDRALAVAEGTITLRNKRKVTKQVMVEIGMSTGGFWGNGITGRRGLNFGGNKQTVDSFSSAGFTGGNIQTYYNSLATTTILGHTLVNGNGSVASLSVEIQDISVGNADIYGSISTGASQSTANISSVVGPNGSIYNQKTKLSDPTFNGRIDTAFVAYDFYSSLPSVTVPSTLGAATSISGTTIGSAGLATKYSLSSLTVPNKTTYTVQGNVTLVVSGDIDVDGQIVIEPNSTLELYVAGDMDIGGNGMVNSGKPQNMIIYGTGGAGQTIKIHGNAFLSSAIYAPDADIELKGGGSVGEMFGAIVGNTVTFAGNNYQFHYDESLQDLDNRDAKPKVLRWVELTEASERKNMATILTNGL